jgi:hypothetical protein
VARKPDLAFEPIVRDTGALLLVSQSLTAVSQMHYDDAVARKRVPEEALKKCAFFRIWCLVELTEALRRQKAVVMLIGRARANGRFRADISMVSNLAQLVDVSNATATVPADLEREESRPRWGSAG